MNAKTSDEDKLKILAKMQIDSSPAALRTISEEMKVPYTRLIKLRKELEQATEDGDISTLVNADAIVVHRVAEEVRQDLKDLAPAEGELISADVDKVVDGIEGLTVLSTRLQTTALTLASKINNLADTAVDSKDILILVESLSKIQMAFFNKNITDIKILNQNGGYQEGGVSAFQGLSKKR